MLAKAEYKGPMYSLESKRLLIKLHDFVQPERHDVQGGHEHKHVKVGHKLWELGVLELTDVSCKGVEVLGAKMCICSLKDRSPVCSTLGDGFQQGKDSCQQEV